MHNILYVCITEYSLYYTHHIPHIYLTYTVLVLYELCAYIYSLYPATIYYTHTQEKAASREDGMSEGRQELLRIMREGGKKGATVGVKANPRAINMALTGRNKA